jgi:hypothetical protein
MESTKTFTCPHELSDALLEDIKYAPDEMLSLLSDLNDSVREAIRNNIQGGEVVKLSKYIRCEIEEWCRTNGVIY